LLTRCPITSRSSTRRSTASKQASEIGRTYFAKLEDPNLARVVQYTSLYHIFVTASQISSRHAAATAPARTRPAARDKQLPFIEAAALRMLKAYAHAPASRLVEIGDREFDAVAPASWPRIPAARARWGAELVADREQSPFASASDAQLASIAKLWADPPPSPTPEQQRILNACEPARRYMQALIDIDQLRADYLATLPGPSAPGCTRRPGSPRPTARSPRAGTTSTSSPPRSSTCRPPGAGRRKLS
jgi:hypothetical protein